MRKNSTSLRNSGTYTSPSTPEYGDHHVGGVHKGWSSERVPLPTNNSRRHVSATALMPFNSGRSFPSKWDDAERWITSPLSSYGVCKASVVQPHRHAKSKSGPLGTPGLMYMPNFSPAVQVYEGRGGGISNFTGSSPFTTGVLVPDGLCIHYGAGIDPMANSLCTEKRIARASSVPGLSDLLSESSLPSSQDDKLDGSKLAETDDLHVVSRRDMATQMSPDDSIHSSPKESSSLPSFPLPVPEVEEEQNKHSAKVEIRDVQVDKGASFSSQPQKNYRSRKTKKDSPDANNSGSSWNVAETTKTVSKEEARITAWENLQKAKAEAAIQKLEMKLEKKRTASMNKILNKLRTAQMKAQEMRGVISEKHDVKASTKAISLGKHFKMAFGCFSCRAH